MSNQPSQACGPSGRLTPEVGDVSAQPAEDFLSSNPVSLAADPLDLVGRSLGCNSDL
jgi:hypothetical protein